MTRPRSIYLDHNATSPLSHAARVAMRPWFDGVIGNPSSVHLEGSRARAALDRARHTIARALHAHDDEIVFMSGGTECNNAAIFGATLSSAERGRVISTTIEHPCVLRPLETLAEHGFHVVLIEPGIDGRIRPSDVEAVLTDDTRLVSIQWANHEVGTLLPIEEIAARLATHPCLFHVDAVQALGKIDIDLERVPIDLLTTSAHKIGGPVGIGALYLRRLSRFRPLLHGGSQELGRRAGTPSVMLAVGFAAALEGRLLGHEETARRHRALGHALREALQNHFSDSHVHTPIDASLANTLSVSFPGCDREALLVNLDLLGVRVSAGAACASGAIETSPVLRAMKIDESIAASTLRVSFGPETTREEIAALVDALHVAVARAKLA